MAVLCEAINVIVPVEVLDRRYPGGRAGYKADVPNATFCTDGVLTRVGFMTPIDTQEWAEWVQDLGVVLQAPDDTFAEMAVVEAPSGLTRPCHWLETGVVDGVMSAWVAGAVRGELVAPQGWLPSGQWGFIPDEELPGVPMVSEGGIDVLVDPQTGRPSYVGRPFRDVQSFDEMVRTANDALLGHRFGEACDWLEAAAALRPLDRNWAGILAILRESRDQ
ncbi:MAG: hypothetical protein QG597_2153 [Actinomycetota bacterium]|nr:hypothetical protein [Actinomycetota bacterium]